MSREEIRVDGLAEPISHFTDAVRAGGFLPVSYTHLTLPTTPYV